MESKILLDVSQNTLWAMFNEINENNMGDLNYKSFKDYFEWSLSKVTEINRILELADQQSSIKDKLGFFSRVLTSLHVMNSRSVALNRFQIEDAEAAAICRAITKKIGDEIRVLRKTIHGHILPSECPHEFEQWYNWRLYVQQWQISNQDQLFAVELKNALGKIAKQLEERPDKYQPSVFLYYAWPTKTLQENEFWIQHFLATLCSHLNKAGIEEIQYDILSFDEQRDYTHFLSQIEHREFVLLFGSESLSVRNERRDSLTSTAMHFINTKMYLDEQMGFTRVFPIALSGPQRSQFPKAPINYLDYTPLNARANSYLKFLQNLLGLVLPIDMENGVVFEQCWRPLLTFQDGKHTSPASRENVEKVLPLIQAQAKSFYDQKTHHYALLSRIHDQQITHSSSYTQITSSLTQDPITSQVTTTRVVTIPGSREAPMVRRTQIGSVVNYFGPGTKITINNQSSKPNSSQGDSTDVKEEFGKNL